MWYIWPPGRKIVTHVGCRQLLLTKGTPIYLVGPFIEGAKVPSYRGRGNLFREALDQPITHHGRLDPSSSLGVHYWRAVVLYHNRGTNKTANRFEQNFVVNYFVLFDYVRGCGDYRGRTTTPPDGTTPHLMSEYMDCLGLGRNCVKKMQENKNM